MKNQKLLNRKCFAFTFAEVLITLGVIGVVAAMTLPTLIKNYQKTVWVNQLKKSMSVISQGLQKAMADEGVTSLTHLSNRIFGNRACGNEKNVLKYFQLAKIKGYGDYCHEHDDGSLYPGLYFDRVFGNVDDKYFDGDGYYLQDGTLFGIEPYSPALSCTDNTRIWGRLWLDVNGDKRGPNKIGRDFFYFYVTDTGNLLPIYSKSLNCTNQDDWLDIADVNWKNNDTCSVEKGKYYGCAARIIENGWKMDY